MTCWLRKRNLLPALVFALAAGAGAWLVLLGAAAREGERMLIQQQLLSNVAAEIERRLSYTLTATYVLAQEVIRAGGRFDDFDAFARSTLEQLGGIANVQLAPDGVITDIHPLAGNEAALGHDILRDDRRSAEAHAAIATRALTLAGPFELVQGGVAVIGRNPVFLPDEGPDAGPDDGVGDGVGDGPREGRGEDRFWGFTSALIMLDDLLAGSGVEELAGKGYGYRLGRFDPALDRYLVFASAGKIDERSLAYADVVVPSGAWTLAIGPARAAGGIRTGAELALALLAAALLALFCRRVVDEPEQLRRRVAEQTRALDALAYTDSLTGLPNRNRFLGALETALARARRDGRPIALMLLDLDRFKHVNDVLGHDVGDRLLVEAGRRMRGCLPASALLARLGGDEFTVIVSGDGPVNRFGDGPGNDPGSGPGRGALAEAEAAARRIVGAIEAPFRLGEHEAHVSASVGICTSDDGASASDLLKAADQAMYDVKGNGRDGFAVFGEDMRTAIADELALVADLRRALARGELELLYQPIVGAATGTVASAEALPRWRHPTRGEIPPETFLRVAEANGLIRALGDWAFAEAAARLARWQAMGMAGFRIGVDASHARFRLDDPVPDWLAATAALGLRPGSLVIEVGEAVLLGDGRPLDALRAAGFEVALDDFGVGHLSLAALKSAGLHYVKLDESFVARLEPEGHDRALCRAIVSLAHRFGLRVVAEGVETARQHALLVADGCDFLQGALHCEPLDADAFEARYVAPPAARAA